MAGKKLGNWRPYAVGTVVLLLTGFAVDRFISRDSSGTSNGIVRNSAETSNQQTEPSPDRKITAETAEGRVSVAQINVGPFDIHRKYRSMEGPFVDQTFTVADLIESGKVTLPEPMVRWVEKGNAASMSGASASSSTATDVNPVGLTYADISKRDLYWLKSVKLQVLDENNKILPTAEFICHMNLDVDSSVRDGAFRDAEKVSNTRLITLTQGQTEIKFPEGYGVPVASFEPFRFTFQAANRTTNAHRRVKHLCTLEFIKDSDLKKPLTALAWYAPYIAVNIDKTPDALKPEHEMHGPSCLGNSVGRTAPNFVNGSVIKNNGGEHLVGHWAIPTGVHKYSSPITDERDFGFNQKDRIVHCVWSHIHPMCNETTFSICDGEKKTPLWKVHSQTDTSHGLEIKHIDDLYSTKGILLPKGQHYEMSATYDNTSGQVQDSMVVQGIFYEDDKFLKPNFTAAMAAKATAAKKTECSGLYCGIKPPTSQQSAQSTTNSSTKPGQDYGGSDVYPLFAKDTDGPLLTASRQVQVLTSAGNLNLTLDPSIAPITATQIYRLFQSGAFGGTTICNYTPGYFLQMGAAYQKRNPDYRLPDEMSKLMRRLPLETAAQDSGRGLHKKYALDMIRNAADDSGVSSFSIMLADEPHLDHKFTVFGYVNQDAESLATISKMTSTWTKDQMPFVMSATDKQSKWLATAPVEATVSRGGAGAVAAAKSNGTLAKDDASKVAQENTATAKSVSTANIPLAALADRTSNNPEALPVFNPKTDGPLLTSAKRLTLETSAGNIHLLIEPSLAPQNATQMYSLFKAGAFNGTGIVRYEPNFVLQTGVAETKANNESKVDNKFKQRLRRLPLEVACQDMGKGLHQKWALSMAHTDADPNSATTSFSILLGSAPHLDHRYTVFGHVIPDDESKATISKMTAAWSQKHPFLTRVRAEPNSIAYNAK